MFRVLIVDDHPALREGLSNAFLAEPGLTPVGAVGHPREALPAIEQLKPDVVVLDYRLPGENGLSLCSRIKARSEPPAVLIYSAHSECDLTDAALLAGSDGLLSKSASVDRLMDVVKLAARRECPSHRMEPRWPRDGIAVLDAADVPILRMTRRQATRQEIATALRISTPELDERIRGMLGRLQGAASEIGPAS